MGAELITKYFNISQSQLLQFEALYEQYKLWNDRINVISRKDFDSLYLHHILHSLAIAKVCQFNSGAKVIDVGCGGGFPCVPLAIFFPDIHITAVDSIGKKIRVVNEVCAAVGIKNITTINDRVEKVGGKFDYVVSRAVTDISTLTSWVWGSIEKGQAGTLPNGMLCLKGGNLEEELRQSGKQWQRFAISNFFEEEFFLTKEVIYAPK